MTERESTDPWRERGLLVLVAGLTAVAAVLFPPFTRDGSHLGRAVLAVLALAMVGSWVWLLARPALDRLRRGWRLALVALCVLAIGNYYQFNRRVFTQISDYTDITYYYLNSKYFDELSYFGLYAAVLEADRERGDGRTDHIRTVRNLTDYRLQTDAEVLLEGRRIRDDRFTAARWKAFGEDQAVLLKQLSAFQLETNFFVDHGYNPPPPWTLVGGALAEATPVAYVPTVTHVDTALVVLLFGVLGWGFGWEVAGLALLWFCCTFSGRWPILGQSLLRFDWLVAVVASLALLRRGRTGSAGAALAYAAANRVFPVIFAVPVLMVVARDRWRTGALSTDHRRFLVGLVGGALLLGGASLARYGPSGFQASVHNLWMHNQTYSSHRVGLGDVLVYRGETTREQINEGGGIREKEKAIEDMQWPLRAVGLLALGLVGWAVLRGRREDWETVAWAALPLFCVTNAQINYWNLRLALVVWHLALLQRGRERRWHLAGLGVLFACEAVTQAAQVADYDRYTVTTLTSYAMLLYFVGLSGFLATRGRGAAASEPSALR